MNIIALNVLREFFQGMPYSNRHRLVITKAKTKPKPRPRPRINDRDTRIIKSHCDLCNDDLPKEADNIEYHINILDEIDDSFESEYDKHEPRLLLCSFCTKEYNIPSYYPLE